jgi:16S rRNA (cytosine1402-N4)-methyltransferase
MVEEVLSFFPDEKGVVYDLTVGTGGHTFAFLTRFPHLQVIGVDQDGKALKVSRHRLKQFLLEGRLVLFHDRFENWYLLKENKDLPPPDFFLLDLGMSSFQLMDEKRGFSYFHPSSPLDLRMDPATGEPFYLLLKKISPSELEQILRKYGEFPNPQRIARKIKEKEPETVGELLRIVYEFSRENPHSFLSRLFQSFRIFINKELDALSSFLTLLPDYAPPGSIVAILTYHSLEDRLVKKAFQDWEKGCVCPPNFPECRCGRSSLGIRLTRKGVTPTPEEVQRNPRSRSAHLRVFQFSPSVKRGKE